MTRRRVMPGFPTAAALLVFGSLSAAPAGAQTTCTAPVPLTSGLRAPLSITQSNQHNLIVAESGNRGVLHSGRISIVGRDGLRRTLVDGLPSATNDANDPSGPAGLIMRGRTLYVAIGIGDTILPVGATPVRIGNPAPSSRLFSSVLAAHFSANIERTTSGFSLTTVNHEALANGETVRLTNADGDSMTLAVVANFPDYIANPLPTAAHNVRGSNPFDLELIDDQLFVTDGGRNLVWKADIDTGAFAPLVTFPTIPNTTGMGGPFVEAVPTGIREIHGQLFVTLFRGFPFPQASAVEQVDPLTGARTTLLQGLRTAIDVASSGDEDASVLVLEHTSGDLLPPFNGPGSLRRWDAAGPTVLTSCLARPTSMARDERDGVIYITELLTGRIIVVP
jgi:hypothetical protein